MQRHVLKLGARVQELTDRMKMVCFRGACVTSEVSSAYSVPKHISDLEALMKTMTRPQGTAHAEHELAQLAMRFQDWRHRRTSSSDPIPQPLWEQAVALTTVLAVSRVAQGIGVSWGTLKKRCPAQPSPPAAAEPFTTLGFVEVATPVAWPVPTPGTEIELQRRDGARRRIHSSAAHLPLATLLRTFLETP